jgi:hypothetical protein
MRCGGDGNALAAILLCLAVGLLSAASTTAGDATERDVEAFSLVDRAFQNLYADDYVQGFWLKTRSRGGDEMSRQLQITRKQSERPGKALVRFLAPYEVRNTAILVLENDETSDDQYVYLPAAQRTIHLSSAQRADTFFGTDLAYEDLEPKYASDYRVASLGDDRFGDLPCHRVEIRARAEFDSTYDRMESCVEPDRAIMLWIDFYRRGKFFKRLEIDPAHVRPIQDRFIPFRMTMSTPQRGSETVMETESYELRPEIPERLFSVFNLESGDAKRDRQRAAGDAPTGPPDVAAGPPD